MSTPFQNIFPNCISFVPCDLLFVLLAFWCVLNWTVLYCTALYCTVPYRTEPNRTERVCLSVEVFTLDISSALQAYEVEYHVLQEEMSSPRPYSAEDQQLQAANDALRQHNTKLTELLQQSESRTADLEELLRSSKSCSDSLEQELRVLRESSDVLRAQVDSLQHERAALLRTVERLHKLCPEGAAVGTGHVTTSEPITREMIQTQVFGNIVTEQNRLDPTGSLDDRDVTNDNSKVTGQAAMS